MNGGVSEGNEHPVSWVSICGSSTCSFWPEEEKALICDIPLEAIALAHEPCDTARTMESVTSDRYIARPRRRTCTQQSICIKRTLPEPPCATQPPNEDNIAKWLDGTLAKLGDITQAHDKSITTWRSLPNIVASTKCASEDGNRSQQNWLPRRKSLSTPLTANKSLDASGSEISAPSSILRNSNCLALTMSSNEFTSSGSLKRKRIAKRCSFTTEDDTVQDVEQVNPIRSQTRLPTLTRKSPVQYPQKQNFSSQGELASQGSDTESAGDDVPGSCTALASMNTRLPLGPSDVDTAYMKFFPRVPPSLPYRVILEKQGHQCPSCSRLLLVPRNAASSFLVGLAEAAGLASRLFSDGSSSKRRAFALPPEASLYCHFSGLLFCQSCHIHESMTLPANVISAWDFTPRELSRPAARFLRQHHKSPFLQYRALHPAVKKMVPALSTVHATRKSLIALKDFFLLGRSLSSRLHRDRVLPNACDVAAADFCSKLLEEIIPQLPGKHWISIVDLYSLYDLEAIQIYAKKESRFSLQWGSPKRLIGDVFGCASPPLTAREHAVRVMEGGEANDQDAFLYEIQRFVAESQEHVRKCRQCSSAAAANQMLACLE